MSNVRRDVEEWLRETGLPWDIENGGHHAKIRLAGKIVGIIPTSGSTGRCQNRARLNIRAQIRRAAKEQKK